MASGKELKISASLEQAGFQAASRALTEMTQKAKELAKALQGVGMPGGGGGLLSGGGVTGAGVGGNRGGGPTASIAQGINANANVFKNMATLGTASLKGLTDALKTSTQQQKTQLDSLQRSLNALGDTYDKLKGKGTQAFVQKEMIQVAAEIRQAQAGLGVLQGFGDDRGLNPMSGPRMLPGARSGLPGMPTGLAGAAWQFGNGNIGAGLMTPIGPGNISPQGLLQSLMGSGAGAVAFRSAGLVAGGAQAVASTSQGLNNMMIDTRAGRGQAVRGAWERMRRADISDAMADRTLAGMSGQDQIEAMRSVGSTEEDISRLFGAGWKTAKSLGKDISALTPEAMQTAKYEGYDKLRQRIKDINYDNQGRALASLDETRSTRMTGSAILGWGYNQDKTGKWSDDFSKRQAALHRTGYSVEELAGATTQARNIGGDAFARSHAGSIMGASRAGFDVSGLLGSAARSSGNGQANFMARAAMGGGIATAAGIQLGQSLFGFDPRGTVTGAGALQAVQQGFGFGNGPEDFNQVQRAQLGMQAADRLGAGFDNYQKGMNVSSAIRAMPGGTTYAQDALANMQFKELAEIAGGGSSAKARAFGITKEQAISQLGGQAHGLFARYVEQGGQDEVSKAMRAMRSSGMSEREFLADLGTKSKGKGAGAAEARAMREALGVEAGVLMGGDTEGGIGLVDLLSGTGGLGKGGLKAKKNLPYGGIDAESAAKRGAEADQMLKDGVAVMANIKDVVKEYAQNKERLTATESFKNFASEIDVLTEKFQRLAGATEDVISKSTGSTTAAAAKTSAKSSEVKAGAKAAAGAILDAFIPGGGRLAR